MATVNLSPAPTDLVGIRAGDRNLITFTVKSGGVAMDLTGKSVEAQARLTPNDSAVLAAVVTITDAVNGKGTLRWPGDAVRTLLAGAATWAGVWDMQMTTTGQDPVTITAGTFGAVMDVTRP